jgi:hypothetical protein
MKKRRRRKISAMLSKKDVELMSSRELNDYCLTWQIESPEGDDKSKLLKLVHFICIKTIIKLLCE